jgi:hypothetical protein
LPKGKTKGSPKESLGYGSSGISPDDYFFADRVSVDKHGVFLFFISGFGLGKRRQPGFLFQLFDEYRPWS